MRMKRGRTVLCLLLCLALAATPVAAAAPEAERSPGYILTGAVAGEDLTVSISLTGANAVGGKLALRFDPAVLELKSTDKLASAVQAASGVTLSTEGMAPEDLMSNAKGILLFGWNPSGSRLDAREADRPVCTVAFRLKGGEDRLDGGSLQLFYTGLPQNWDSPAAIMADSGEVNADNLPLMAVYKYNVDGVEDCNVTLAYPGSDRTPAGAAPVELTLTDKRGEALPSVRLSLGGRLYWTDSQGKAAAHLTPGSYSYKANVPGHEDVTGTISVPSAGLQKTIVARTYQELVEDVAAETYITLRQGSTVSSVKSSVILPHKGTGGTVITWSSSHPHIIAADGTVFRPEADTQVTLTAAFTKEDAQTTREYRLTVAKAEKPGDDGSQEGELNPPDSGGEDPGPVNPDDTVGFQDLDGVPWAREAIEALAAAGIINGTSPTTFAPQANIKRGDFVRLLVLMLKPEGTPGQGFSDVPEDSYYHDQIVLAQGLGIAQGNGGKFRPNDQITRQDMMVLTYRALKALDKLPETSGSDLSGFTDGGQVAQYAREAAASLTELQYIQGSGGKLRPLDNTTRAETAVFLYRIYQNLK